MNSSCIQEFDGKIPQNIDQIVIEGRITTRPGPYHVRLTQSHPFDELLDFNDLEAVENAAVSISDDEGNSEELFEVRRGIYSTALDGSGIRGVVGRKYQLRVITTDGIVYQSGQEEITQVPPVDSVFFEVETRPGPLPGQSLGLVPLNSDGDIDPLFLRSNQWVTYGLFSRDEPGVRNYYKWNARATFEVGSNDCWLYFDVPSLSISDDLLIDGKVFRKNDLGEIQVNNFFFSRRFYLEIEQASINFQTYLVFRAIKKQQEQVGGLFDTAPELLTSNLFNPDRPEEVVLGYFWASDVKTKSILINIDHNLPQFSPSIACRDLTTNLLFLTGPPDF